MLEYMVTTGFHWVEFFTSVTHKKMWIRKCHQSRKWVKFPFTNVFGFIHVFFPSVALGFTLYETVSHDMFGRLCGPISEHIRCCFDEGHGELGRMWRGRGGGGGDVVIGRLHYTIQCTTVLLLCNELLVVSNHAASEYSGIATAAAAAAWRSDGLRPVIPVVAWAGRRSAVPPVTM